MPLFNSQNQNARSGRQLAIVAMALLQLLVLFAIGAAVIRYLEWSSDAARAEFTRAIEAVSDPLRSSEPSIPSQAATKRTGCNRKG
jgi:hypothetical protein